MSHRLFLIGTLTASLLSLGCKDTKEPGLTPFEQALAVDARVDSSPPPPPVAKKKRRKRRTKRSLPAPTPPPPRPEGEPSTPADFNALSTAAQKGAPVQKPGAPPVERIDAFHFKVGSVLVDQKKRHLNIPGKVNMVKGILEYYAVGTNGKTHESVLELLVEPSHIHLGLLLLDVEQSQVDRSNPRKMPVITKPGGQLKLFVEWVDPKTKKPMRAQAEDWLYTRKAKKAPKPQIWTFHGSSFWNNRYSADMDRSIIGLIADDIVVIAIGSSKGNPYQGNQGYEVFTKQIPPKGTLVTLVVEVHDGKSGRVEPAPKKAPGDQ